MTRSHLVGVLVVVLIAGCTAGAPGSPGSTPTTAESQTPTLEPSPSDGTPTTISDSSTPPQRTASPDAGGGENRTITYVIRSGSMPDEFAVVNVTVQAVFVDQAGDLGRCYPEVFSGPYKPTLTPIGTPVGECHRTDPITINLADLTGAVSLGNVSAPGTTNGHALLVTNLTVTRANGTMVDSIKNIGGAELIRSPHPPEGPYGVELSIETVTDDRPYDYWLVWDHFVPTT